MRHFVLSLLLLVSGTASAQRPTSPPPGELYKKLQHLQVLGSVLYIAAHPDDENTRLLTYLAQQRGYKTSYLSLTRGDGGQNLIGPELREKLGLIRTQELLAARQLDGAEQFFTRAVDFGYSKHPDETWRKWDRQMLLHDVVWVIRNTRPDVIITRFSLQPGVTHGHHTASAQVALEAMDLAADPEAFPEQLQWVDTWQPQHIYWNTHPWFYRGKEGGPDFDQMLTVDIGAYDPLLGSNYSELAALSRSSHRSQSFGALRQRGTNLDYLTELHPDQPTPTTLFEGIATSWQEREGLPQVQRHLEQALQDFRLDQPSAALGALLAAKKALAEAPDSFWKQQKMPQLDQAILDVLGCFAQWTVEQDYAVPGEMLTTQLELICRLPTQGLRLEGASLVNSGWEMTSTEELNAELQENVGVEWQVSVTVPSDRAYSQPYWLRQAPESDLFTIDGGYDNLGKAENDPAMSMRLVLAVHGQEVSVTVPLVSLRRDPALGEVYEPLAVGPAASVEPMQRQQLHTSTAGKELVVRLVAQRNVSAGVLGVNVPAGWKASPSPLQVPALAQGQSHTVRFTIAPKSASAQPGWAKLAWKVGDELLSDVEVMEIDYDHIPKQRLFEPAQVQLQLVQLDRGATQRIVYVPGAGDAMPEVLEGLGYDVVQVEAADLSKEALAQADALLLGIRAFNTQPDLLAKQQLMWDYAQQGGVVVVQYNTSYSWPSEVSFPAQLTLGRDRVTDETAEVSFIDPKHPVLNAPNKIAADDWQGWVQERGLYFASDWDDAWQPVLSMADPGEEPLQGSLLVLPHGDGRVIYTGLSFFRELPAGVPGACRLLANMLAR